MAPFCSEYQCEYGHRFDDIHMGARETAPEYVPCKGDGAKLCSRLAERVMSAPTVETIVKGNHDFLPRQKERLTKRSQDWDKTSAAKAKREEVLHRQIKNKNIV